MTPTKPTRRFSIRQLSLLAAAGMGLAVAAALYAADPTPLINPFGPAGQTEFSKKAAEPPAGDLPMWGGTPHRNMVSAEKNPPTDWDVESKKNIKWVAK